MHKRRIMVLVAVTIIISVACSLPAELSALPEAQDQLESGADPSLPAEPQEPDPVDSSTEGEQLQETSPQEAEVEQPETAANQENPPEAEELDQEPSPEPTIIGSDVEPTLPSISADEGEIVSSLSSSASEAESASESAPDDDAAAPDCVVEGNLAFETILLNLINQERTSQGLRELVINPKLVAAARAHSRNMACSNFFSHTDWNGYTVVNRVGVQGYEYTALGENIFAGTGAYNCAQEALKGWINSPAHRDTMFGVQFEEVGIGYASAEDCTYDGYFTAVFGTQ